MYSFAFAARFIGVCLAFLIAASFPAVTQDRNISRCLSIAGVNERIDCLESGGTAPNPGTNPTPYIRTPKPSSAGPSFDCRTASNSIERAICSDPTLSDWDYRMGQQYQQVVRSRKDADAQQVVESQRAWVIQRNSSCSGVADTAIWGCLLDMTKQRTAVLVKASASDPTPMAQLQAPPQGAAKSPTSVVSNAPPSSPANSSNAATSKPIAPLSPPEDSNHLLVVLFFLAAAVGGIAVFDNVRRKERLAEEQRLLLEHRDRLVSKYGALAADRILAKQIWQGMTEEQLIESWGMPADKDTEIKRTKTKETWKYGQTGRNRFSNRVFVEDGIVIGWKD